ncbi:hypothetical protein RRSWK_04748 [Rhodopirellula sp. SWK7]|nr:hypothetical protein RRSWK_04748 [Rhodopirellula sp. SWK7]
MFAQAIHPWHLYTSVATLAGYPRHRFLWGDLIKSTMPSAFPLTRFWIHDDENITALFLRQSLRFAFVPQARDGVFGRDLCHCDWVKWLPSANAGGTRGR